jgi:MFS family permease
MLIQKENQHLLGLGCCNRRVSYTGYSITGSSILPLVLVTVHGELNISNADAGLIISMYGVLYVVGAIVLGAVADKLGLRKTLTLSSIIVSFGILSMSAANSLITCMIAYAIIGFGSAALITLIPKLTGSWFEIKRRGLASSYITSGGAASAAILGIIVPILAISYSWRAPFYILGFVSFLVSVLIFAMVKDKTYETN